MRNFESIVVGAGLTGTVIAEQLASVLDHKVLVFEKKWHLAGHCFDYYDEHGILVHKYGPHIFHTNYEDVWAYISRFTDWHELFLEVVTCIDGKNVPIPFNLRSFEVLFPPEQARFFANVLIDQFGFGSRVPILQLRQSDNEDVQYLATFIYEKMFLNYMLKQWASRPEEMDSLVTERIPIEISYDNRYFRDKYQGLPKHGYTGMLTKMLEHQNIRVMLNTDASEYLSIDRERGAILFDGEIFDGQVVYTGPIDELFDYELGELPYRSLRFSYENLATDSFQEKPVISYPNNFQYIRITEYRKLTGQQAPSTTIAREFPLAYDRHDSTMERYYPVLKPANRELYKKYREIAREFPNLHLIGRLAEYAYYNMDETIKKSLDYFMQTLEALGRPE